ncbi:hypothetical protein CCMA1212_001922 [Trichoderma ghanense]|uniref:Uncharacterized protein n=1 Tax=Trichoderma ghanense TaxID=65468 RepID=A0ABY2HBY0_9HYPO
MARHRHGRSPARKSTPCHQAPCRHSAARPSASHDDRTPLRTDFIPSWLQNVQTSYYDSLLEVPREASPADAPETSWHPNGIPYVRIPSTHDAGRYQSSDLFIQDSPSPAPSAIQTGGHHHHESDLCSGYGRISVDRGGGHRSRTTTSTPPPASVVKDDAFEKRLRRKTRKDRYNTVKSKDAVPTKKQAKKPSTRVSKSGRLRSSREVMANFKSSAITNPNERITLKSTFTPGLFVNGRGSAPVADLVFNEIPPPDEDSEPFERNRSSNSRLRKSKEGRARQEEIEYLTSASKRLREDYPAPEYLGSRSVSILSGGDFPSVQRSSTADVIDDEAAAGDAGLMPRHGGLDGGGAPDQAGNSHRLRPLHDDHELQSHKVCDCAAVNEAPFLDSNILNTHAPADGDSRLKDQKKSPEEEPEIEPIVSRGELKSCGSQTVKLLDYQDKGVMVSPRMYQPTEIRKQDGTDNGSQPLCPDEGDIPHVGAEPQCPHAMPQRSILGADQQAVSPDYKIPGIGIPSTNCDIYGYPTYVPGISASLDFGAVAKDAPYHYSGPSPAWFFGKPSSQYPLLTLDPYSNPASTLVDDPGMSASSDTQSRNTRYPGILPQPTGSRQGFQIFQEANQDLDFFCTNALQDDEDVPGESLTEYIERMEHEILGPDETSSLGTDDGLLPPQPICHDRVPDVPHIVDAQYTDGSLHRMASDGLLPPRGLARQPVREELGWPSQQYQSLPRPENLEGLDHSIRSEMASFWRPNYMMWC